MISTLPSNNNTSIRLGRNTRFLLASQCVNLLSVKSVTTRVLKMSECTSRCWKRGLRFPLSAFHCRFLQYLRLAITQISPNTWRVFLGAEVLYRVMFDGACRMMVEEFFHCYRPSEITQSKSMYSFVPKSLLLRLVCNTPDSSRNWKSRCIFIQGDDWMCHPSD